MNAPSPPPSARVSTALPPTATRLIVAGLLILALGLRVWEVQRTPYTAANDARSYLVLAGQVARGGDYSNRHTPGSGAGGSRGPTAYFPPAFPYLLAAVDLLDGHTSQASATGAAVHPARILQALLGTATVGTIGLVAFEAFGETVALLALMIAAVYPALIELSGTVYSENLLIPLSLAAVWAALRARRAAHPYRHLAAAGLLGGLATLTHENGAVVVLALLPLSCAVRRSPRAPIVLLVAAVLTVAPWTIRNAVVLHRFIPVSDETGLTLAGTYNPSSAADRAIPYRWLFYAQIPADASLLHRAGRLTEPQLSSKLQSRALHYIARHPTAPLAAAYHNTRRLLELEGSTAWRVSAYSIGVPEGTARLGVVGFWILALLAIAGAFTRSARRPTRWLWAVPALYYLSVVFVNAETPRFRAPIDPFLIMLAACALAAALGRLALGARRGADQPVRQSGVTSSVRA